MNIQKIIRQSKKPELYEKGSAIMWTDSYISEQLLQTHLNPDIDLASRKDYAIEKTVSWILRNTNKEEMNILDLGCGPGLYAERFAKKGHKLTGVDFSENSINYAKRQAIEKQLDIQYLHQNYLELDLPENEFDLVLLIFTDFGPLLPNEREQLLKNIKKVLKPDGIFIFDVLNDENIHHLVSPKSWEAAERGFWRATPYVALSESFLYENEKAILYQHIVAEENGKIETYRFWNHFFSNKDLTEILAKHSFNYLSFYDDVLPKVDEPNAPKVTFCKSFNLK